MRHDAGSAFRAQIPVHPCPSVFLAGGRVRGTAGALNQSNSSITLPPINRSSRHHSGPWHTSITETSSSPTWTPQQRLRRRMSTRLSAEVSGQCPQVCAHRHRHHHHGSSPTITQVNEQEEAKGLRRTTHSLDMPGRHCRIEFDFENPTNFVSPWTT